MTNILNSLTLTNNNVIPAKKIKNDSGNFTIGVQEAPQSIYKYSLTRALEEKDTFRKQVLQSCHENNMKVGKRKNFGKLFAVVAAIAGFFVFSKFKKH